MSDRIEVAKLHPTVLIGPPVDVVSVPKLVMYVLLQPGTGGGTATTRQGHVYVQIVEN